MALDVACRQTSAVEQQDLLVEVRQAPEVLRHELRLEGGGTVTRHRDVERASAGEQAALGAPVARVLPPGAGLRAEVGVELGLGDALDEASGERRDEAVGAEELVGITGGCEQLVDDFGSDVHGSQGVREGPSETTSYTRFLTLPTRS